MKFFCEYCGCRIDAEKDTKCPNCGASYKKNETFIRLEKEKKERLDRINEFGDKVFEQTTHSAKVFRVIFPIVFVTIFLGIIITFISIAIANRDDFSDFTTDFNTDNDVNEIEPVIVNGLDTYGEYNQSSTLRYRAKVTGYEVINDKSYKPQEGYEYVKFQLVVENLSTNSIRRPDVNCIVDGIAQTNYYSSGHSTIPFSIEEGLTVKGEAIFEVPKDATSYDIRFDSKVTIHIEKPVEEQDL